MCIFSFGFDCSFNFFCSIPFTDYSTDWSLIKSINDDVRFLEFSNSIPAFSWNSGIPSPPNLGGSDSRTRSSFEQMCPLVVDGINLKQLPLLVASNNPLYMVLFSCST